jgi:hypothetical protein
MGTQNDIIRRPSAGGKEGGIKMSAWEGRDSSEKCDVAANRVDVLLSESPTPGDPHQSAVALG